MFSLPLREDAELRPLGIWHAEEFAAHMDRTREHIRPWTGAGFPVADVDAARALLGRYAERLAKDTGGLFGIWKNGTLVGGVLFVSIDAKNGVCEIGCWLEPEAQGGGLITDACRAQLNWVFAERGLHRVEWHCRADNEPSKAVAKRLGMRLEGTLKENWPYQGERYDTEIWAILKPEWDAAA